MRRIDFSLTQAVSKEGTWLKENGPFKCVNRVWRGDWLYNLLQYKPQNWLEISCIVFVNISTLNDVNALLMLESNKGSPKESKYSITFPGITNRQTKCDPPWFDELKFIMKQLFSFSKSFFFIHFIEKNVTCMYTLEMTRFSRNFVH